MIAIKCTIYYVCTATKVNHARRIHSPDIVDKKAIDNRWSPIIKIKYPCICITARVIGKNTISVISQG